MRITLESDYALRIVSVLSEYDDVVDANTIAEKTSVSLRFALKILHKLVTGNIVSSYKGAKGGYKLKISADEITLKNVIELIDGPIGIVRCLGNEESCALNTDKTACVYHHIFDRISFEVAAKLNAITIADIINKKINL